MYRFAPSPFPCSRTFTPATSPPLTLRSINATEVYQFVDQVAASVPAADVDYVQPRCGAGPARRLCLPFTNGDKLEEEEEEEEAGKLGVDFGTARALPPYTVHKLM